MASIRLYGRLRKKFAPVYDLNVSTPREAIRALCTLIPSFEAELRKGYYRVVRGARRGGLDLDPSLLGIGLGSADLHIIPFPQGANKGGMGKVIAGVVIIIAAAATWYAGGSGGAAAAGAMGAGEGAAAGGGAAAAGGFSAAMAAPAFAGLTVGQVAFIGASIALGGVSALLAPNPSAPGGYESRADDRPSFLFSGVVNVSEQGVAVPLCYGLFLCGSVVISSGLEIQELMSGDPPPPPPPVPDPEQFPFDPTYGGVIFGSWDTTSGGGP